MRSLGKQIIFWTTLFIFVGCLREPVVLSDVLVDSVGFEMSNTDSLIMMTDTVLKKFEEKKQKEQCKMDSLENQVNQLKLVKSNIRVRNEKVVVTKKVYTDTIVYEFDSTFGK
jgi:hypothetical protein